MTFSDEAMSIHACLMILVLMWFVLVQRKPEPHQGLGFPDVIAGSIESETLIMAWHKTLFVRAKSTQIRALFCNLLCMVGCIH